MNLSIRTLTILSLLTSIGCADPDPTAESEAGESESESSGAGDGDGDGDGDGAPGDGDGAPLEPPMLPLCGTEPPAGAQLAPELPTYAGPGTCPVLETDGTFNVMQTTAGERQFLLIAPSDPQAGERYPVMFMYHWLGGSAEDFVELAEAQAAADHYRVIAIVPEGRDSTTGVPFRWPFSIADDEAQVEEEFAFHDDMLACVAEQFPVDKECVSSMGVSAGALFTGQLAGRHGDHLASFLSLSGGVGGDLVKPWQGDSRAMPAMVLWGGPGDLCLGVDFNMTSMSLEAALEPNNHFILECEHNCGHGVPPFDPADPSLPISAPAWQFFLDHPYWLEPGESPYFDYVAATGALPPTIPEWCAIGSGNAVIREGACEPPGC
jgi:pimeloyl-ACP methyl ester carboxylesterase